MYRVPWRSSLRLARSSSPSVPLGGILSDRCRDSMSWTQVRPWCLTTAAVSSPADTEKRVQVQLKVLRKPQHGLTDKDIPLPTWKVLETLRRSGHEAYLVGGSVRDLLLNQIPKDFDVLSTAEPYEVKRRFPGRCIIVGKRFPICHVNAYGTIIEVSSFSTKTRLRKDQAKLQLFGNDTIFEGTEGWDDRDFGRWENSMKRDFTVNGLMYDPFAQLLYDYVGGLQDLRKSTVRTVIPADKSFTEDSARILRAIRIAARLGFRFTKSTAQAIKEQRFSILKINKGRLMLEANMFFSYGAAEPTLRLLWRYGVLELLLPLQAAYLVRQDFKRRDPSFNLLLDFLKNLDKVVAPDRPCHGSLWVALLAFHLAISDGAINPLVTATAALVMVNPDNKKRAAKKARRIHSRAGRSQEKHENFAEVCSDDDNLTTEAAGVHERIQAKQTEGGEIDNVEETSIAENSLIEQAGNVLEQAKSCLNQMMDSNETALAMRTLTSVEVEDSVAIGQTFSQKAYGLFKRAGRQETGADDTERSSQKGKKREKKQLADPESITRGDPFAISYIFSRVVLNSLYPRVSIKTEMK